MSLNSTSMKAVTGVRVLDGFQLELHFNNGETRIFDARPYLDRGAFRMLNVPALFAQAFVAFDTVCWPGHLDIAPETLYDRSRLTGAALGQKQPAA
jgi:hypothetical protein